MSGEYAGHEKTGTFSASKNCVHDDIMMKHEVMAADEWHKNGTQDPVTVSLCIQMAMYEMQLCLFSVVHMALCCVTKLHILEWPFIVPSTRFTGVSIMLFNQLLDMPHLSGGWIILAKDKWTWSVLGWETTCCWKWCWRARLGTLPCVECRLSDGTLNGCPDSLRSLKIPWHLL